jgi:hypothetical protein
MANDLLKIREKREERREKREERREKREEYFSWSYW